MRALREELSRDRDVVLLGEDIGPYGGNFKVTEGLWDNLAMTEFLTLPSLRMASAV